MKKVTSAMKTPFLPVLLLLPTFCLCTAREVLNKVPDTEIVLASIFDYVTGTRYLWTMDREAFAALPKYSRSEKPTFDLDSAIKVGEEVCAQKHPDADVRLNSASFGQPIDESQWRGVFFYFLTFEIDVEGKESHSYCVLVLPTGNVIGPQELEIVDQPGIRVRRRDDVGADQPAKSENLEPSEATESSDPPKDRRQ